MKYLRLWMILLVAVGGAVLFACGGDSDDDDSGDEPTAAATSDDGSSPTEDGSSDGNGDGDSGSELRDLAAGMADHEGKIAYNFTSSGAGTDSTGSFTLFWRPPDSWRLDIDMDGSVSTFIAKEGTTYVCSGDGSGGGTCFASPTGIPLPFLSFVTDPDSLANLVDTEVAGVDFEESDDEIAGQSVTCYSAAGSVEGQEGNAEYCFNDDGLMLRFGGGSDAGGSFTLEATSVESSVADEDLELPYEILDIPGQ